MPSPLPGQPFRWSPKTVSDSLFTGVADGPQPPGSMMLLQNLVPDPYTPNTFVCRPASVQKTDFTGFTTPGFVSGLLIAGDRAYGMIASGAHSGKDEPFCYDLLGDNFVSITGVTSGNVPTSPATSGEWTPPQLALVGQFVCVTHPGFDGVTNFVGWIDLTNFSSPVWSAGNLSTSPLPSIAIGVAQFNGRAYYLVNPPNANPAAYLSDSLAPKNRDVQQTIVTFGDNVPLVAAKGMPLSNQLGGIIQSLMVFKANNIHQITGDPSNSTLAVNSLNVATGTKAANSICPTPRGLAFISSLGLRFIDFSGQVSPPVGYAGTGISVPFINALYPSRMAAACNASVLRMVVQNSAVAGNPAQEWWYDIDRQSWSGPHTFIPSLIGSWNNTFILTPIAVTASLWRSDSEPSSASTYTENGTALQFNYQTSLLPDSGELAMLNIIESDIWAGFDANSNLFTVTAYDENGVGVDSCQIEAATVAGGVWGVSVWGGFIWGGIGAILSPRRLKWTKPLTFVRLSVSVIGTCSAGVRLGDFFARVETLAYIPNQ